MIGLGQLDRRPVGRVQHAAGGRVEGRRTIQSLSGLLPLFLGGAAAGSRVARSIAAPLSASPKALRRLAAGEMAIAIPGLGRPDAIGQMAAAAEMFRDRMVKEQALAADPLVERAKREERAHRMEVLTRNFDRSASARLQQVDGAAAGMREACRALSETAVQAARQVGSTAGDVCRSAEALCAEVLRFLAAVRAA